MLPAETRGIGMSLWIVLCRLLIVTLPRNMGAGLDVLLDFFENGHPHPRRARPEARPLVTILALFFTFREKEFLFYDFFWVWEFSLFLVPLFYFYVRVPGL